MLSPHPYYQYVGSATPFPSESVIDNLEGATNKLSKNLTKMTNFQSNKLLIQKNLSDDSLG